MDIWYLFAALVLIFKKNSTLCFIATNQWIMNSGASKFRNKILKETQILLFNFGDYKIFDSAGVQTMIMKLSKKNITKNIVNYSKIINSKNKKA